MTGTHPTPHPSWSGAPRSVGARQGGGAALALAALVGFSLGCAPASDSPEVAQGQALYEAHCASCHGEGAQGDGPLASTLPVEPPSILEHLGHHTRAQLNQLIGGGIPPAMPPSPISEQEIQSIVDYAWTLVPESEREGLRAMQERMEAMGGMDMDMGAGNAAMPGMERDADAGTDREDTDESGHSGPEAAREHDGR